MRRISGTCTQAGSADAHVWRVVIACRKSAKLTPCHTARSTNTSPTEARVTNRVTSGVKNQYRHP